MKQVPERKPMSEHPQPGAGPGEQRPQHFQNEDEADAFSRWLAHVEAGRIGYSSYSPFVGPEICS